MKNYVSFEEIKDDVIVLKNLMDIRASLVEYQQDHKVMSEIEKSITTLLNVLLPVLTSLNEANYKFKNVMNLKDTDFLNEEMDTSRLVESDIWVD